MDETRSPAQILAPLVKSSMPLRILLGFGTLGSMLLGLVTLVIVIWMVHEKALQRQVGLVEVPHEKGRRTQSKAETIEQGDI